MLLLDFDFEWLALCECPLNVREVVPIPKRERILNSCGNFDIFLEDVLLEAVVKNLQIMTNIKKIKNFQLIVVTSSWKMVYSSGVR
jgi:hypothetical protein